MYDITSIYQAKSVDDAIEALQRDPQAIVIAGGTDVLIKIREGKDAGCSLVSIHELKEELEGVVMQGDVRLLTRALNNLIGNSIRHNSRCRIEVKGELVSGNGLTLCRIAVKDDGKGIPAEIRNILTEDRNLRAAPGKADNRGESPIMGKPYIMGKPHIMGLRIVKQIVNAHGGRMDFSADGREVILYLPAAGTLEERKERKNRKWWEILWYGDVKGE